MRFPPFRAMLLLALAAISCCSGAQGAEGTRSDDDLDATLWDQTSVEAEANAIGTYALAKMRLDQALADPGWTAAPQDQTGDVRSLPPAVILDVDDTVLNTSPYQAWTVKTGTSFTGPSWTQYVRSESDAAVPGAVDFTTYAVFKGVKVFYVTNRTVEEKSPTLEEMARLGFPTGGADDTFLAAKQQPDWGSAKGTRRAFVGKSYRILLLVGDQLGDFTDAFKGSVTDRQKVFQDAAAHWGRDWIAGANPTYGSFESAPFGGDYKLPLEQRRQMKLDVLKAWDGP